MSGNDRYRAIRALAFTEAERAAAEDEVPVGAVIFHPETFEIIASAHNQMIGLKDPTAHAEISAVRSACRKLDQKRLDGYAAWVTLEPCAMCLNALREAHVHSIFYVAPDQKTGDYQFSQIVKIDDDAQEAGLLKEFFKGKRLKK